MTSIEWTDQVWNPTTGCDRISSGCDNCYPIPLARIRERNPNRKVADAFAGVVERTENGLDWTGKVNLLPERLEQPLKWRKPRRIFVNSLSDLFHEAVDDEFIARVFAVMAACPQHTFQVLTKRHARMRSLLNNASWRSSVYLRESVTDLAGPPRDIPSWPLPNVHVGVSVEDQRWADIRIPALLETPAAVRWISAEPLLGPVDLSAWLKPCPLCDGWGERHRPPHVPAADPMGRYLGECDGCGGTGGWGLDWVVVGGESGPGARPMHPDWARSLRDQCVSAGVPYFFKQWGAWEPIGPLYGDSDETEDAHMEAVAIEVHERRRVIQLERSGYVAEGYQPTDSRTWLMARVRGKKSAGRELDGRTWDELPRTAAEVTA